MGFTSGGSLKAARDMPGFRRSSAWLSSITGTGTPSLTRSPTNAMAATLIAKACRGGEGADQAQWEAEVVSPERVALSSGRSRLPFSAHQAGRTAQ